MMDMEKKLDLKKELPENIIRHMNSSDYVLDEVGMSSSDLLLFRDQVLKIEEVCEESDHEPMIMEWLQGRLPVSEVIARASQKGKNYLLMSRLPGVMSCHDRYLSQPELLAKILAGGLRMLWSVDAASCPFAYDLNWKLRRARYYVEHDQVDWENIQPETKEIYGFHTPRMLLEWLEAHRPEEEFVFPTGIIACPTL